MTRGKYAQRATKTRDLSALEQRALAAEHERNRLSRELAAVKQDRDTQVAALKVALRSVTAERDANAGPVVAELERQNGELRERAQDAEARLKAELKTWRAAADGFLTYLTKVNGLTANEALEVMVNMVPGKKDRTYISEHGARDQEGLNASLAIQRARGQRHRNDVLDMILNVRDETLEAEAASEAHP